MRVVNLVPAGSYFDQAAQLHRHGFAPLDYCKPVNIAKGWSIPHDKMTGYSQISGQSLPTIEYLRCCPQGSIRNLEITHDLFRPTRKENSRRNRRTYWPLFACYEAILEGKRRGIRTIVDHGSLHEATECKILVNESESSGSAMLAILPKAG